MHRLDVQIPRAELQTISFRKLRIGGLEVHVVRDLVVPHRKLVSLERAQGNDAAIAEFARIGIGEPLEFRERRCVDAGLSDQRECGYKTMEL